MKARVCHSKVQERAFSEVFEIVHAIHGWDAFLDVFGNPSISLELPPTIGEHVAKAYGTLAGNALEAVHEQFVRRLLAESFLEFPFGDSVSSGNNKPRKCPFLAGTKMGGA